MKSKLLSFLILLAVPIALFVIVRLFLRRIIEKKFFENDRVVDKLPSDLNLEYEEISIDVGLRELQAWLVKAPLIKQEKSAILIFHGGGETISWWISVQKYLYDKGISSMVFDYSAYGKSTGEAKLGNLREDAVAAYEKFDQIFSQEKRKCVLGFSLGAAVLLEAYPDLGDSLDGIVLAHPFSSTRDLVVGLGYLSRHLAFLVPDILNNETYVKRVNKPLLVISSEADKISPLSQAQKIFNSANEPKELIIHPDVNHNGIWENPTDDYWLPITRFIEKLNHLQWENLPNP
jgi:alpha-beta hydrolase superfamily lysophospholipase